MLSIVIGVGVLLIGVWAMGTYYNFVLLRNKMKASYLTIETFLKRRYDIIESLLDVIKKYKLDDNDILSLTEEIELTILSGMRENPRNEIIVANLFNRLLKICEDYSNLKLDSEFIRLKEDLEGNELEIESFKVYYNNVVLEFNISINNIPNNIIAKIFNIKEEVFFELKNK